MSAFHSCVRKTRDAAGSLPACRWQLYFLSTDPLTIYYSFCVRGRPCPHPHSFPRGALAHGSRRGRLHLARCGLVVVVIDGAIQMAVVDEDLHSGPDLLLREPRPQGRHQVVDVQTLRQQTTRRKHKGEYTQSEART
eukprot:6754762-Pyramimonas_sp.AAC.2